MQTQIRREIDNTDSDYDREKLQELLAASPAASPSSRRARHRGRELKERKHRIEDAVRNAKAGSRRASSPVVARSSRPARCSRSVAVRDEATGANIVKVAIEAPLKQIALNAGLEPGVVANKVAELPAGHGLNAASGEYGDLFAQGIIDPAKVTRSALQNAASIAGLFLTTEAVVADKPEKAAAPAGDPTGGMDF